MAGGWRPGGPHQAALVRAAGAGQLHVGARRLTRAADAEEEARVVKGDGGGGGALIGGQALEVAELPKIPQLDPIGGAGSHVVAARREGSRAGTAGRWTLCRSHGGQAQHGVAEP